ncbi:putative blue pigment (indigoidine) exporter [Pseudoclavibacter chungangensis]|nr:EamA family transporter [Pseudoclavibacter chungangensis]NYJ66730.1 putative blue pigment (indigoidine) exporter [Pseudoclavibacter chungangensis]
MHTHTGVETTPATATTARVAWTGLAALAPIVWGTTYVVTTRFLPEGHPVFAAMMRALPAGLIALALTRRLPTGSWWWRSAVLGTLNMAAFFPLLFVAAQELPGGVAATLGAAQPLVVAVLAIVVLGERGSVWRMGAGVLGVVGIALVVLGPGAALSPLGIAAGLCGALSMGLGVVLTKKWGRPPGVSAITFAGWQLTAAGLVLLLPALLLDGVPPDIDGRAVVGYAWLTLVGGLAAYAVWFAALGRLPVTATALLGPLSPLVAALVGVLVGGESLGGVQVLGFAIALAAMVGGQLPPPRSRRAVAGGHEGPSGADTDVPLSPATRDPRRD